MDARRTIARLCQQCGADFLARPGRGRYCSRSCVHQATRKAMPRVTCPCVICGTIRLVKPSVVADGKGTYCSKACRATGIATHGETRRRNRSPEYIAWTSIKTRCLNPNDAHYPNYGGRGITICDAWRHSFAMFLADVGRRPSAQHSIDRIDNAHGHYEPGNVRWTTSQEQAHNRRTNRLITFQDVTQCLSVWANEVGIGETTLQWRLQKGWSIARALTTLPRHMHNRVRHRTHIAPRLPLPT